MNSLSEDPYDIYLTLVEQGIEIRDASVVLFSLLNGIHELQMVEDDQYFYLIQEVCGLNEDKAHEVEIIFRMLHCNENLQKWKAHEFEGFNVLKKEEFVLNWEGFAVWHESNGTIDCHYHAKITLCAREDFKGNQELKNILNKILLSQKIEYVNIINNLF